MSTPRTKRMKQFHRLNSASHWIKTYNGKSLVNGYAKRYGLDKLCAIKELRMLALKYQKSMKTACADLCSSYGINDGYASKSVSKIM